MKIMRADGFDQFWQYTIEIVPLNAEKRAVRNEDLCSNEIKFKKLFFEVIDNLSMQVSERFSSIEKLKFFNLLNGKKILEYRQNQYFPDDLIKKLIEFYPEIFEFSQLKN